jgi:hypothetical protein
LITNIETTPATTPDDNMIEVVHQSLERRNLLPSDHLVDKGYTDAKVLVVSKRDYGVEIIGPVAQDLSWQTCNMSSLPSQSTSCESRPGQAEHPWLRPDVPISQLCNFRPDEFATCVNVGSTPSCATPTHGYCRGESYN